ncbi:MFS transporter [Chitinimonas lacunae]|uniref:MFS transporter n=1 Tax=Chitinimonas lacunae TaxID=1963018 RepID=A0ABV8MP54_9NEIS
MTLQTRLILMSTLLVIGSAIVLSWLALGHFERTLPPEMARTVAVVGRSAGGVLESAYRSGVPPDALVGAVEFLDSVRRDNPGVDYLAIADPAGNILYRSGAALPVGLGRIARPSPTDADAAQTIRVGDYYDTRLPLADGVSVLHLGQQAAIVEDQIRELGYDVLTVLIVATLIAMELLRFVLTICVQGPATLLHEFLARVGRGDFRHYLPPGYQGGIGRLNGPLNRLMDALNRRADTLRRLRHGALERVRGFQFHLAEQSLTLRDTAVDYIRWPFFLLIFAESLSLSFFPLFVGQFYSPHWGLSRELVIGLPISIFMFVWALSMPWAGLWGDRVGHRRAFAIGATVTCAGLLLTAGAQSLFDLVLWRSMTALGYGLVFVTAQSYIANNTPPEQRTKGMAIFLASFFAGSLSGAAIGGILADRVGYGMTFLLSAGLSAATALFALRFLHAQPVAPQAAKRKLSLGDFRLLLRNPRFVAITFLAAIPSKIALTGFLYYAAPLYLKYLGSNQSSTGRAMMAYGLVIVAVSPMIARLADRFGHQRWFVGIGGYMAALAMLAIYLEDNTFGVALSITLLGVAHSIGVSPQLALVGDFCKDVVREVGMGTATGIFRLIERLGNVLGPLIAGLLITHYGFKGAFYGIGILCLVCATLFTGFFQWIEHRDRRKEA